MGAIVFQTFAFSNNMLYSTTNQPTRLKRTCQPINQSNGSAICQICMLRTAPRQLCAQQQWPIVRFIESYLELRNQPMHPQKPTRLNLLLFQ